MVIVAITAYLLRLWVADYRAEGEPKPGALPGAVPAPARAIYVAVGGAVALVALETAGEYLAGTVAEQGDVTFLYLGAMISAAFTEELIFRGYLVVTGRGKVALVGGMIAVSLVFALLHPLLWEWGEGGFALTVSAGAMLSTAAVFLKSMWFYAVRFLPLNPRRSLLPCIMAHLASNIGVFIVKALQGHVVGWY